MTGKCGFSDVHFHPNPMYENIESLARRFKRVGGWFAGIVSLPPWNYGFEPSWDSYLKVMDMMEKTCRVFQGEGVETRCFSGFHPAEVDRLIDVYKMKPEDVVKLGMRVLDEVVKRCVEGRLHGIGEVGRQHYKTFADRVVISELLLEHAIRLSRDHGCPIQMHLENTESTIYLVDLLVEKIGLTSIQRRSMIFHHVKPGMAVKAYKKGYSATIPGTRKQLVVHLYENYEPVYMLESDYVGGSKNPGNTLPWSMFEIVREAIKDDEYLCRIMHDNVSLVFHVDI